MNNETERDLRFGLTLVAFYGEKANRLADFIAWCQALVSAHIETGFLPYEIEQVHATIVGLESRFVTGALVNEGFLRRGEIRPLDIPDSLLARHVTTSVSGADRRIPQRPSLRLQELRKTRFRTFVRDSADECCCRHGMARVRPSV